MTPEQFTDFINGLFVRPDGSRKKARINLIIESEQGTTTLAGIEVAHSDTLQTICRSYLSDLQSAPPPPNEEQAEEPAATHGGVQDIRHISHGQYEYIVFAFKDGSFGVQRRDGKAFEPGHVIYNTLVKKYREESPA